MNAILEIQDLRVQFNVAAGKTLKAVDGVSLRVNAGETLGIIGESGSGKSTLGRTAVCLQRPLSGRVRHAGTDPFSLDARALRTHRRAYQIIFQDPHSALNPRMTVLRSVREPLDIVRQDSAAQRTEMAMAAIERVGLRPDLAHRYPHELSGGQKQRICIARALVVRPRLIVCDEVVAALDLSIRGDILNLFNDLQREYGLTYLFITHDLSVVAHISDRIAVMYLGSLVELAPALTLTDTPAHPYTRALLGAEPVPLPAHLRPPRPAPLTGEIPSPVDPPSGCRFRTRCPQAREVCTLEVPAWRELASGHWVACHFAEAPAQAAHRDIQPEAVQP